jgi:hypothetical protein
MGKLPELPVKVEVGAKATLDIKSEVPAASAGRFVDALTDIIRPWTEKRGLKADLIRLQREDVAYEIARRAARRIESENPSTRPIPLKILIPLLEKGSQEQAEDDFMIDMWANLLAASATDASVSPRFVGIIGELNGRQARLIRYIAREKNGDQLQGSYGAQQQLVMNQLSAMLRLRPTVSELSDNIRAMFRAAGTYLDSLNIYGGPPDHHVWTDTEENLQGLVPETDLEILASLGLLERVGIHREVEGGQIEALSLQYYRTTLLAEDFLNVVT